MCKFNLHTKLISFLLQVQVCHLERRQQARYLGLRPLVAINKWKESQK
jgi:hypothetical protein